MGRRVGGFVECSEFLGAGEEPRACAQVVLPPRLILPTQAKWYCGILLCNALRVAWSLQRPRAGAAARLRRAERTMVKKGLSLEEKRTKMLEVFHESVRKRWCVVSAWRWCGCQECTTVPGTFQELDARSHWIAGQCLQ